MDIIERLQTKTLFVGLADEALQQFADIGEVKEFKKGDMLISEGTSGGPLFILLSGEVLVFEKGADKPIVITTLYGDDSLRRQYRGDFVGEMSLLDFESASASVEARTDLEAFILRPEKLKKIFGENPGIHALFMANLARILSRRLREINRRISGAETDKGS